MIGAHTLWGLVERRAAETPDRDLAVDERGRRLTFEDYRRACVTAAAGLAALGVRSSTPVSCANAEPAPPAGRSPTKARSAWKAVVEGYQQ